MDMVKFNEKKIEELYSKAVSAIGDVQLEVLQAVSTAKLSWFEVEELKQIIISSSESAKSQVLSSIHALYELRDNPDLQ